MTLRESTIWSISGLLSLLLLLLLLYLWYDKNTGEDFSPDFPLLTNQSVDDYLEGIDFTPEAQIKTGLFIQSLKFQGASDVHLTGYIWLHYEDGVHDTIKPKDGEVGFVFPEAVDEASGVVREAYRHKRDDGEVIGWYFEQVVRQKFIYTDYPFDHKLVWLRLWPKDFSDNVLLVPDFSAYDYFDDAPVPGGKDVFGIEEEIVLGTWDRENTFFCYHNANYDTNFGIPDYVGQTDFPELYYTVQINRKFSNAFIVHMIPLLVVATLLFGALMTNTRKDGLSARHGASTANVIGTCSALFFVVLLAHVQLRDNFPGSPVVYLEYFYFLMYFLFLAVSINAYILALDQKPALWLVHYNDNLIPKATFWPVVIASMVIITLLSGAEPSKTGCSSPTHAQLSSLEIADVFVG